MNGKVEGLEGFGSGQGDVCDDIGDLPCGAKSMKP